jgi:hypothetical protein
MKTVRVMKIVSHDEAQLRSAEPVSNSTEGGVDLVAKIVVVY